MGIKKILGKLFPAKTTVNTSGREGLFTQAQRRKLARKADDKVVMKGFKEKLDGPTFLVAIWLLNKLVFDKLPEDLKTKLYPVIDMILGNIE